MTNPQNKVGEFTPGPWAYVDLPDGWGIFSGRGRTQEACVCGGEADYDVLWLMEPNEADRALIAAAPDLYAALESMAAAFKPFTMKPMGAPGSAARFEQEAQIEAAAKAHAALSKASGTAVNHPNSGSSELPVKVPNPTNGETA